MATSSETLVRSLPDEKGVSSTPHRRIRQEMQPVPGVPSPQLLADILAGIAPPLVPLTTDQYLAMIDTGILPERAPIELIDGLLIWKDRRDEKETNMTEGSQHYLVRTLLRDVLDPLVRPHGFHVAIEPPVLLPDSSIPEPDIAILRGRPIDYRGRIPKADDAVLVVEVSWSSLQFDRRHKRKRYAAAEVPAYWIVDLTAEAVEAYSEPGGREPQYGRLETYTPEGRVPLRLPDTEVIEVPVSEFLPQ